mmetsp:Transcript_14924/g.10830  ORF Transcript_14924/g.10830 Transcript_14924/m.10830 type:complete len:118 (+) Transcript_14924:398-751(+)
MVKRYNLPTFFTPSKADLSDRSLGHSPYQVSMEEQMGVHQPLNQLNNETIMEVTGEADESILNTRFSQKFDGEEKVELLQPSEVQIQGRDSKNLQKQALDKKPANKLNAFVTKVANP